MPRVRSVFAAPFVVTAALGGCKNDDPPKVESRVVVIDARPAEVPTPDAATVKVLPDAPADAITIRDGVLCKRFVGNHARAQPVHCPTGGATLTAPPPRADPTFRYQSDYFQCSDFSRRSGPNPPASVVVPCPPDLLPTLNASLEPTRNGDACSYQGIQVQCP